MASPTLAPSIAKPNSWASALQHRIREFKLIAQDPILLVGLLGTWIFILVFILMPLLRVIWQGFFSPQGALNLEQFQRYFDPYYEDHYRKVVVDTLQMGVLTALGGTALGFLFAYTVVRCDIPFKRLVHVLALLPTISPPFAIAIATILLFGRAGLVTHHLFGIEFGPGMNTIYGMDGLVFVQIITFFSVAYLIIRGMLERLDPAMEEAAQSLGASKGHIFRTVTFPLLIPGMASSFLLLFVESLADLGNPLLIAGNTTVLSAEIFLAVNGQHDQQKGAALSLVLLIPTLTVFLLQRYWVSHRSYISVTGKPTGGHIQTREPYIRYPLILLTVLAIVLILALYGIILVGSLTKVWGVDYTPDLGQYEIALRRGLEAFLDTTFLSAVATPIAGLIGMLVAFLVVRKIFSGREALDFGSTLGGAVPGTILGIGYILAFIKAPMPIVALVYVVIAYFLAASGTSSMLGRLGILLGSSILGYGLTYLYVSMSQAAWLYMLGVGYLILATLSLTLTPPGERRTTFMLLGLMGLYLFAFNIVNNLAEPLATWGRTLPGYFFQKVVTRLAEQIQVPFQAPLAILGLTFAFAGSFAVSRLTGWARPALALVLLAVSYGLTFVGEPLALVGTPYIVIAAYAVRSLPASVRAGVAALHQIDPAIEEASTNLGADTQLTFRRITLPLILPAFIAGLIFSFARHMTSISAIIFLTTPKWRILTVQILSEVEQGGMSTAAAYSVVLIVIVLIAIGLVYWLTGRTFARTEGVDLTLGAG